MEINNSQEKKERKYLVAPAELEGKLQVKISYGASAQYVSPVYFEQLKKEAAKLKITAGLLIGSYPSYLHAEDRANSFYILDSNIEDLAGDLAIKHVRASQDQLGMVIGRAKNMIDAQIPPIFTLEQESRKHRVDERGFEYETYPTLDGIINIFTREHLGSKYDRVAKRVNAGHVRFFRDYALREAYKDKVKTELLERVEDIFEDKFTSRESGEYVLGRVNEGFEHLVRELQSMPRTEKFKLGIYDPKADAREIVSKAFWYTQFTKDSVPLVLSDFWAKFRAGFIESDNDNAFSYENSSFPAAGIARKLFPEIAPLYSQLNRARHSKEWMRVVENRDYGALTEGFMKYLDNEQVEVLQAQVQSSLAALPIAQLSNQLEYICKTVGLPSNAMINERLVLPTIDKAYTAKVQQSTDQEIVEYFNQYGAHRMSRYPMALDALSSRLQNMIGEIGTKADNNFSYKASKLGISERAIDQARKVYHSKSLSI